MDLIKESHRWTLGACMEWNMEAKQFSDMMGNAFIDFVNRTHTVVYRYLQGRIRLDGACSDLECSLAEQAKKVFKV